MGKVNEDWKNATLFDVVLASNLNSFDVLCFFNLIHQTHVWPDPRRTALKGGTRPAHTNRTKPTQFYSYHLTTAGPHYHSPIMMLAPSYSFPHFVNGSSCFHVDLATINWFRRFGPKSAKGCLLLLADKIVRLLWDEGRNQTSMTLSRMR